MNPTISTQISISKYFFAQVCSDLIWRKISRVLATVTMLKQNDIDCGGFGTQGGEVTVTCRPNGWFLEGSSGIYFFLSFFQLGDIH